MSKRYAKRRRQVTSPVGQRQAIDSTTQNWVVFSGAEFDLSLREAVAAARVTQDVARQVTLCVTSAARRQSRGRQQQQRAGDHERVAWTQIPA
ncbi:MAG: hypothetical protein ACREX6_07355, partial [Casimicrobiaceae bacterium]